MSDPAIALEDQGSRRRSVLRDGAQEAGLTVSVLSPDRVVADHTFVPESMRGQGIATRLLDALLADARAKGFTIAPLRPFVAAQARRHPEWDELFER